MTNVQKLVAKIATDCQKHNIEFHLIPQECIISNKVKYSGYFDDESLKVACGKIGWVSILAHESCHMDQFLEKHPLWKKADVGITIIEKWCSGTKYSSNRVLEAFKNTIELERDCEIRTEKKIKKFKIKINFKQHRKQVNSYLFSYWATYRDRKWFCLPYNNPKIVSQMPSTILPLSEYLNPENIYLKYYR